MKDQELLIVFDVAWLLAARQPLETMLAKCLSSLIERWDAAEAGVLLLYDPADDRLKVAAAQGYDVDAISQLRIAPGESMSGSTFQSGESRIMQEQDIILARETMSPENRAAFNLANISGNQPKSVFCLPLRSNGSVLGVLILENLRQTGSFKKEDLSFLERLTEVIGLAVATAVREESQGTSQPGLQVDQLEEDQLSTLAHEMRTPLTSIKGYSTALLMDDVDFSPESQREFLKLIDEECDTLQYLIHDFLESSNIGAGLLNLEIEPVLLGRLVRNVTDDMMHRSPGHRFLVDLPNDLPIVDADPDRIVQVLRNLLDNAIKYSPQGGLVIVRVELREQDVVISVADQGIGIAPDDLHRLFDKFFRAESSAEYHVVGSGLGLPIARTIVESHGGRIWAESQVDQGSTLCFTIPFRSGF